MPSYADSVNNAVDSKSPQNGNVTAQISSSNPKVASSVFEVGPRDANVPVDNFGRRAVSAINQEAAGLRGAFDGFFNSFKIVGLGLDTLTEVGQIASDALRNVEDSRRELEQYTGLNLSSVGAFKDSLSDAAVITMSNVTGYDLESVMRDGDEIMRICDEADLGSVNGLISTTNRLLGVGGLGDVVDMRAECAVWSGLLQQSARLGMIDTYDLYYDQIQKNDAMFGGTYGPYSASMATRDVVQNGDLIMLNKLIDSAGGTMILQQYPDLMVDFLQNYRLPYGKGPEDYPELRNDIITTFNRLDPLWFSVEINNLVAVRLDAFLKANSVSKAVFTINTQPDDQFGVIGMAIADSYPRQNAGTLLDAYYPYLAMTR
jgi:hypothetical protein